MSVNDERPIRLWADFNGLFGEILCLSHRDTAPDENGNEVSLRAVMFDTVFMEDLDEQGSRDDLIASTVVEPAPPELRCRGSRWILRIDDNGVRHESDVAPPNVDYWAWRKAKGSIISAARRVARVAHGEAVAKGTKRRQALEGRHMLFVTNPQLGPDAFF